MVARGTSFLKFESNKTQCFSLSCVKEWLEINPSIPLTDKIINAYRLLLEGKELNEDEEGVFGWFITTVLPIIHLASWAKFNWHPFSFISGVTPTYSFLITNSDEAMHCFW